MRMQQPLVGELVPCDTDVKVQERGRRRQGGFESEGEIVRR